MKIVIDIDEKDWKDINDIHFIREDLKFKIGKTIMNGTPLPEHHGDLIDRTKLYNQTAERQAQALEQVKRYNPEDSRDEWRWWSAVLKERGAFKYDVADAPTIIEGSESK